MGNSVTPRAGRPLKFTARRRRLFLEALAAGHSVTRSAELAHVSRETPYHQRTIDPDFAAGWADALERQADAYEDALRHAALQSHNIGGIIWGLKNLRPSKWRDRHDIEVRPTVSVELAPEDQARLQALVSKQLPAPGQAAIRSAQDEPATTTTEA